jgi:hypothetical protein
MGKKILHGTMAAAVPLDIVLGHTTSRFDMIDAPSVDVAWPLREFQANYFVTTTDAATEHRRVSRISREKPRWRSVPVKHFNS